MYTHLFTVYTRKTVAGGGPAMPGTPKKDPADTARGISFLPAADSRQIRSGTANSFRIS